MFATLLENGRCAEQGAQWDAALTHYEAALTEVAREGGGAADVCQILRRIGIVHQSRGDLEQALEIFETVLVVAEMNELDESVASVLISIAAVHQSRGELDVARAHYERSGAMAVKSGDEMIAAAVEQNLAILANIRGETETALASYGAALERFQRLELKQHAASVLLNMAISHIDLENWQDAERCCDEAHGLASAAGDRVILGVVELNRAELYLKRQSYERARDACDQALGIFGPMRAKPKLGEAYKLYGILHRDTGKLEQAGLHLALSVGLAEVSQDRLLEAEAQLEWALVHVEEERYHEAIRRLNRSYGIFEMLQAKREIGEIESLLDRLRRAYMPAVTAWGVQAVEKRDPYRPGSTDRIVRYCTRLGEVVGLGGWELTWLRAGAAIHDVGYSAMPMEVLAKAGTLSHGERELLQSHTVLGDVMSGEMNFPAEVRAIVRGHHEQWNGGGYPDRLVGEEIPLGARILSVADCYDALTSERSWRPAYQPDDALGVMRESSGQLFDPQVFDAFEEMVTAGAS
ncbi:MAG TPA: HD domain-containing phosphohydrolase [Longimicrobiaceae bacterium]|nr:HD domain-containing phosphohydrolase [Longimicrobiaceae bacterium]